MDVAPPSGETGHDFFRRARARLTLDVPAALDDHAARRPSAAISISIPRSGSAPASRRRGRPRCSFRLSTGPSRPCCSRLRTELPSHPGQIAFPGGKIDPHDATPGRCGVARGARGDRACPALIEPIGYLDLYLTFSGYRILPTVARVRPDYQLVLCEAEVADAFEVPLAFLMDAQNHALHSRDWKGIERKYYAMPFGERYIWGVTAGILRNLYERIYRGCISMPMRLSIRRP